MKISGKKKEKINKININKALNIIQSIVIHTPEFWNILIDREQEKKIKWHFKRKLCFWVIFVQHKFPIEIFYQQSLASCLK